MRAWLQCFCSAEGSAMGGGGVPSCLEPVHKNVLLICQKIYLHEYLYKM